MGPTFLRATVAAAATSLGCLGPCHANPIAADDAAAQTDADGFGAGQAAGTATPGASMPLSIAARGGTGVRPLSQERADAMASARNPALLPIDMQGVGAQAHPTPSALPKGQGSDPAGDDGAIKNFALTARDWIHDVFGKPEVAPDMGPGGALRGAPGAGGDLGLPVETQSSGVRAMAQHVERPVEVPAPGAGAHRTTATAPAPMTAAARLLAESGPEYAIQRVLNRCRVVLVHPLTWLAIVLIGVTHILMSRGRR